MFNHAIANATNCGWAGCHATTTSEFSDYQLRLEFRHDRQTNSGVFLRTPLRPSDPSADCYELNIAEPVVSPFPTGSLVRRARAAAESAGDGWQAFEVEAVGGHIRVALNGREVGRASCRERV